ncbi:MAG: glycosyltransferase family 2 protein [Paludibacter sp.]
MVSEYPTPLLTIAIPTYNGSQMIKNVLDSVLSQYESNVEVLISNNCSTDSTSSILKQYKEKYPYIRIVNNSTNIGPDANFLQCYQQAKGKFVLLLSDDDVLVENGLKYILQFLEKNPEVKLVHLNTIDFREKYIDKEHCIQSGLTPPTDICTSNKQEFMTYAIRSWGFISSYICSTSSIRKIINPERFFGTYWLQSYINILCAAGENTLLGNIKYPCIGAGRYININSFDSSIVDGIYYKKMLDFAVAEAGFDKSQLEKFYIWRLCLLGSHIVVKEKASGIRITNVKRLVTITKRYPKAWFTLYPILIVPAFICKLYVNSFKALYKITTDGKINRPD